MRIWLSFLFLPLTVWGKCDFRSDIHAIYSLSGPITTGLKVLGLQTSAKLKGISTFYETAGEKFHGSKIPGGSLLSPVTVRNFERGVVFFDEAQETEKILKAFGKGLKLKKISTRNLTPMEVTKVVAEEVEEVTSGCGEELKQFERSVLALQKKILQRIPNDFRVVFYLGGFEGIARPDLVMANDGFVKWLKDEKKILTYPTSLAYVPWSAKIMKGEMNEAIEVGIMDANKEDIIRHPEKRFTLQFPRALTPGIDQLEALNYLLEKITAPSPSSPLPRP